MVHQCSECASSTLLSLLCLFPSHLDQLSDKDASSDLFDERGSNFSIGRWEKY